jgi:hypothetical protein
MRILNCWAALLAAVSLSACTPSRSHVTVGTPVSPPQFVPAAALLGSLSDLRATLRAPARLAYDPQSLGAARQFVSISLENVGDRGVPVAHLHASFATTRDGVAFPCNAHVHGPIGAIEPLRLDAGQSFTFERALDCTMPLPGRYDVRVWIHGAGHEETGDRPGAGVFVGSFSVDLTANGDAPHPVVSHVGLYAMMTGAPTSPPMTADAWAKGGYRVVVALVNGTQQPMAVGPCRLSLLLFRQGAPLPCTGRQERLDEPDTLAPGGVYIVRVPVTCAPAEEGRYQIIGRLAVGSAADAEIGRVGLLVTESPDFLFMPVQPSGLTLPRMWMP